MLKHGQWLRAAITAAMIDNHDEHVPSDDVTDRMLKCATSHDLNSEKLFLIGKRVLVPKDEGP